MELSARALRTGVSGPGVLLRVEGTVLLVLSVLLYWLNGGSWVLFGLLFLAPDLSMLGYVVWGAGGGGRLQRVSHLRLARGSGGIWLGGREYGGCVPGFDLARPHRHGPDAGVRTEILRRLQGYALG